MFCITIMSNDMLKFKGTKMNTEKFDKNNENQKIQEELKKIGGSLSEKPVMRWLLYKKTPYNILGLSGIGIIFSFLFINTMGHSVRIYKDLSLTENGKETKKALESATAKRNTALGFLCFFIANFIFWTVAITNANKQAKREEIAVKVMLKIKEEYPDININEQELSEALKYVPYIISKMAAEERVYFDMLAEGDLKLADSKIFHDLSIEILIGHLKTHEEDFTTLMNVFRQNKLYYATSSKRQR